MVIRMLGWTGIATSDFSDVNTDAWYAEAISIANAKGLIAGRANGTFDPNASITREEAMVIAAKVLANLNVTVEADTTALNGFSDSSSISSWAKDAAATLVKAGIISGSNGKLNPKANITRAEICVILEKIITEYKN